MAEERQRLLALTPSSRRSIHIPSGGPSNRANKSNQRVARFEEGHNPGSAESGSVSRQQTRNLMPSPSTPPPLQALATGAIQSYVDRNIRPISPPGTYSIIFRQVFLDESDNLTSRQVPQDDQNSSYIEEEEAILVTKSQLDRFLLREMNKHNRTKKTFSILPIMVVALSMFIGYYFYCSYTTFDKDMDGIGAKYGIKEDNIRKIKHGVKLASDLNDIGSFTFIYNSDRPEFNKTVFEKLMNEVAETTAKYLRNDNPFTDYESIQGNAVKINTIKELVKLDQEHAKQDNDNTVSYTVETLKYYIKTYGNLIKIHRDKINNKGVVLFKNIELVPSSVVLAFHFYNDENFSLPSKAVVFFTLNLANCNMISGDETPFHSSIEKCLADKWNTVPQGTVEQLLATFRNIIIDVS